MEEWSPYEAHDLKTIVRICLLRFDLRHFRARRRQNFRARQARKCKTKLSCTSLPSAMHSVPRSARQNFRARDNQKGNLSFFFFRFENLNVDFGF